MSTAFFPENDSEVIESFKKNLPVAQIVIGDTPARILDTCVIPQTTQQLADKLELHYQTVRNHIEELRDLGLLTRTEKRGKQGYLYYTRVRQVNSYLISNAMGNLISAGETSIEAIANKWEPAKPGIYREFPIPHESLPIRVGEVSTTAWKLLIGSLYADSSFKKLMEVVSYATFHLWYRNYLYTSEGVPYTDLPLPDTTETRLILKSVREQIQGYVSAIKQIIENDLLWIERQDQQVWRVLGDFPVEMAQRSSDVLNSFINEGQLSNKGVVPNINHDYVNSKAYYERVYLERFVKHQKAIADSEISEEPTYPDAATELGDLEH